MGFVKQNTINMKLTTRDEGNTGTLDHHWDETDAAAARTINWKVNAGDRTIDLTGNLTVEAAAIVDQDLSTDATDVDFGSLQLGGGGATVAEFSTDGTLAGNSDTAAPTEQAVKTYVDARVQMTWSSAIAASTNAVVNNGYFADAGEAAAIVFVLPGTAAVGDRIGVQGGSLVHGWIMTAAAGDTIRVGDLVTKAAGSVKSTNQFDGIIVVCTDANAAWTVLPGGATGILDVEVS